MPTGFVTPASAPSAGRRSATTRARATSRSTRPTRTTSSGCRKSSGRRTTTCSTWSGSTQRMVAGPGPWVCFPGTRAWAGLPPPTPRLRSMGRATSTRWCSPSTSSLKNPGSTTGVSDKPSRFISTMPSTCPARSKASTRLAGPGSRRSRSRPTTAPATDAPPTSSGSEPTSTAIIPAPSTCLGSSWTGRRSAARTFSRSGTSGVERLRHHGPLRNSRHRISITIRMFSPGRKATSTSPTTTFRPRTRAASARSRS